MAKFQLAIQGGGARLADLLAAAEVVQEFEESKRLHITRVAGTSAGSIVAALIAAGPGSVKSARAYLDRYGDGIVQRIISNPSVGISAYWKLWWNNALCDGALVRQELTKLFQHVLGTQGALHFKDLTNSHLTVVSASMVTRLKHVDSAPDTDLIEALLNSCSIPLVFRSAKELRTNPFVDGGLCENLPSGELSTETNKFGPVIALSFPNYVDGQTPDTTFKFIYEMFSTAINNSVQRAAAQLPSHAVLKLETERGMLDFAGSFNLKQRNAEFKNIRTSAKEWLEQNINYKPIPISSVRNEMAEKLMAELHGWYKGSQAKLPRRTLKNVLVVTANSLGQDVSDPGKKPDIIEKRYYFSPAEVPTNCLHIEVSANEEEGLFDRKQSIEVFAPNGNPLKTRLLPTLNQSAHQGGIGCLILFEPSLSAISDEDAKTHSYMARYVTEIPGAMSALALKGQDDITHISDRPETYGEVNVIFLTPGEFRYRAIAKYKSSGNELMAAEMTPAELKDERRPGANWSIRGWKAESFKSGDVLRVEFFRDLSAAPQG